MKRLRFDNSFIETVCTLIAMHSDEIGSEKHIRRIISRIGADNLFLLLEVKKADNLAKCEFVLEENVYFDKCAETARELIRQGECMSLRQLAVNGNDMISLGLSGRDIGSALDTLLGLVIDETLANEKESLIAYTKEELL
jgi:tRNA nucleotidyltransferase (CCA-adding enzyme)